MTHHRPTVDVDLAITAPSTTDRPHRIICRSTSGGTADAEVHIDAHLRDRFDGHLQGLETALLASAALTRRVRPPHERAVQALGTDLFELCFPERVRAHLDMARHLADRDGGHVRLALRVQPPELAALPWEFMYDPKHQDYPALTMALVRCFDLPPLARPPLTAAPLRVLGMGALPLDRDPLDIAAERVHLGKVFSHQVRARRALLHWVPGETWRDLVDTLRSTSWHILHLVGHGGFDSAAEEGVIHLRTAEGRSYPITACDLAQLLQQFPSLRLVVLNQCHSGRGAATDPYSSTGATLVRHGVPAVLAMQFEISDHAAIEFTRSFYQSIAANHPVDLAVRNARMAVRLERSGSLEWGTPILFLRQEDGMLFQVPQAGFETTAPAGSISAEPAAARSSRAPQQASPAPRQSSPPPQQASLAPRQSSPAPRVPKPARPGRTVQTARPSSPGQRQRRMPLYCLACAALALVALAGTKLVLPLVRAGGSGGDHIVTVHADQPWIDTGIQLRAGQRFDISGVGQISPETGRVVGPDGAHNETGTETRLVNDAPYAALIGMVGDSSSPFLIGRRLSRPSPATGTLRLGINELDIKDNTGSFEVRIDLE